jgi:hypothetical protein
MCKECKWFQKYNGYAGYCSVWELDMKSNEECEDFEEAD